MTILTELNRQIEAGDAEACLDLLAPLTESQRRALREAATSHLDRAEKALAASSSDRVVRRYRHCAALALIGTGTWRQVKRPDLWPHPVPSHRSQAPAESHQIRALRARRPPWLGKWASWVCTDDWWMSALWPALRLLEREGLLERPEGDAYYRAMVHAYDWANPGLAAALADDDELREHHVFRIFAIDVVPGDAWREALVALAADGSIDRGRLLDACLDGLDRDFDREQASWIRRLHDELEPTGSELGERGRRYRRLLASRNPSTVDLALRVAGASAPGDKEGARDLVRQVEPVLLARAKGTSRRGIGLLEKTARAHPELGEEAALAATAALLHESAEIQHHVLDLLERGEWLQLPAIAERLTELGPGMAATARARLPIPTAGEGGAPDASALEDLTRRARELSQELRRAAGVDTALVALADPDCPPPLRLRPGVAPRLDPGRTVRPVEDVDALLDLCAALLEGERSAMAIDRALEGVSRLCGPRSDDFAARAAPLRQRARQKLGDGLGEQPSGYAFDTDFSLLLLAWIEGVPSLARRARAGWARRIARALAWIFPSSWDLLPPHNEANRVFSLLVGEISRRVLARQPAPLLSFPTHGGGWIDPRALVRRLAVEGAGAGGGALDRVLALLRLAPEHRAEALAAAGDLRGELGRALRFALGGDERPGRGPVWAAAASSRRAASGEGPEPACSLGKERHWWRETLTVELAATGGGRPKPGWVADRYARAQLRGDVPWACHLWPHHRDPLYAGAASSLLARASGPFDGCREAVELLLDPDEPLTEAAHWLLAVALSWNQAEVRGLATDILLAAFGDGRADPDRLGRVLAGMVAVPELVPQRWVGPLSEVARASNLNAEGVRRTLERALGEPAHLPHLRRLYAPLELLHELARALDEPVEIAGCRELLAAIPGKGKNARRAAEILAVEGPGRRREEIAAAALQTRVERAERWARWLSTSGGGAEAGGSTPG